MPKYLPISPPPGFHNHGVDLESSGRWRDGNLVRWEMGVMRPVGGWYMLQRTIGAGTSEDVTVPAGVPRAMHTWLDNAGERQIAVGTNDNLYATGGRLKLKDITPVGFTAGTTGENLGYGGKAYGYGTYGTERISDGTSAPLAVWSLDNFGEYLVACTSEDKIIYVWQLDDGLTDVDAAVAADDVDTLYSPAVSPACEYLFVTAERFLFALAADNNPRKVQWCDREDLSVWAPLDTNEAGDYELQTSGRILAGCRVRGRSLILTTRDAHAATYLGPPNVYGFQRVGVNCGLVSPLMLVQAQQGAFWMGSDAFYVYDGSTVSELPCEVHDHVFGDINLLEMRKGWGVANSRGNEVWWFYPSSGSTEVDRYVGFSYTEGYWIIGEMVRTTGVDLGVYNDPLWADADGDIWRHESGFAHEGEQPWAELGPLVMADGDQIMHVTKMLQDERVAQEVSATFYTNFWPDDTLYTHGPYEMANATDVRFTGRQVRMRLTADDAVDWRVGGIRLEYTLGGRR